MTNRIASPATETINWFGRRSTRALRAQVMGRQAVYTTASGVDMIGTVSGTDRDDWYAVVTFPDGRWARLGNVITLVRR